MLLQYRRGRLTGGLDGETKGKGGYTSTNLGFHFSAPFTTGVIPFTVSAAITGKASVDAGGSTVAILNPIDRICGGCLSRDRGIVDVAVVGIRFGGQNMGRRR